MATRSTSARGPLSTFSETVRTWFEEALGEPTVAQAKAWPRLAKGESTLVMAPTGSGKTLAAFLTAIDRCMFSPVSDDEENSVRVLYVSPLKALAVDIERNLEAPIVGIGRVAARAGVQHRVPSIGIRTGDTPQGERAKMARNPPDILITTPESLYLMLSSNARDVFKNVETVIIDEIHAVAGSKRGAHLFLSLERLEALREKRTPLQRIGLSATQKPLETIAEVLGGALVDARGRRTRRPVTVVDASRSRSIQVTIEVPVEDMAKIRSALPGTDKQGSSIWPSVIPRLVEIIKAHRSTMIFVNSRRLAERLASQINETAELELARAHHGSLSHAERTIIEDELKKGALPCIVATATLELGLDLGAVDMVVQVEAPISIASGLQRVGRANHSVGGTPTGILMPKHRADVLACAAAGACMREGDIETTRIIDNPLDVLAQHIVSIVAATDSAAGQGGAKVEDVFALVRGAENYRDLPRTAFEDVLDMLSGRYPSADFAALRPRIVWDRRKNVLVARPGARMLVASNAGTIPDRGLFGVYLDTAEETKSRKIGELDEEMVFETREGEVVLLGASSWRVTRITKDRVLVVPAPGEPGKMPFWRGDGTGRSIALGKAIGALSRAIEDRDAKSATEMLQGEYELDTNAANNLVRYVHEQRDVTSRVPSDRVVVVERFPDELGDTRVCIMCPLGMRLYSALSLAIRAKCINSFGYDVDTVYSDDGIVIRFPEADVPPEPSAFLPDASEVEELVTINMAQSSIFAARFREAAGRALLLPKRRAGTRTPLWAQRRRAADLLAVASEYPQFPIVLETYRELLSDVFDLPALREWLENVASRKLRTVIVDTGKPSPFAASLLFSYVGNFMYEADAPVAERRAHALAIDHARLRELLGEAAFRDLLDPDVLATVANHLQRLDGSLPIRDEHDLVDLLRALGDLTEAELLARMGESPIQSQLSAVLTRLEDERRITHIRIASELRWIASEDAGMYARALGVVLPPGIPDAFLRAPEAPLGKLLARYARTHGPFRAELAEERFAAAHDDAQRELDVLVQKGTILEGEFVPGGQGLEYCDKSVLAMLKSKTLFALRKQIEPVAPARFAQFLGEWQALGARRRNADDLLCVIDQLAGVALHVRVLEEDVLPARVSGYRVGDLDQLIAAGEVVWRGIEPHMDKEGKIALYPASLYAALAWPNDGGAATEKNHERVRELLRKRGAIFFSEIANEIGGFVPELVESLWDLVWSGEVTNDSLAPLRSRAESGGKQRPQRPRPGSISPLTRMRRQTTPGTEGRWSLLPAVPTQTTRDLDRRVATERADGWARLLLARYGLVTRETAHAEGLPGGFSAIYGVLSAMEDAGQVRRGYFMAGAGALQFAWPGVLERLRAPAQDAEGPRGVVIASTDPANPYGAMLPWPAATHGAQQRPQRSVGTHVVLERGMLAAWLSKSSRDVVTFLPEAEPERGRCIAAVADALARTVETGGRGVILVRTIDGGSPSASPLGSALAERGFAPTPDGLVKRVQNDAIRRPPQQML